MTYRIGTRGSKLALIQTELVRARLIAAYPQDTFEVVVIRTTGDVVTDRPIAELGGSAVFTREIERALLDGCIDLAVHSMKDLAAELPDGLTLAKAWPREDPRDALVCRAGAGSLADLPTGAVVATGSVRRQALLQRRRPDLRFVDIRGNVETRLRKLFDPNPGEPQLDAVVLAVAGLKRLGRADVISEYLDPAWMIPAPNQGQLALELRVTDRELKAKLDRLGDDRAEAVASAERQYLRDTGADCHRPVGAHAVFKDGILVVQGVDGTGAADLRFEERTPGIVTLVGAGPGDPDLITVKGAAAIREAEALVFDRLVSPDLLALAPPSCRLLSVGKASGNHTLEQDEINALLVRLAFVHRRIVRLKGGDPFVFGRGGEELTHLRTCGIPCRVIPGVTAAVAAAESFGIPVTQRGVASGFIVVTAHAKEGEPLNLDFSRLTDPRHTVIVMMGLSRVRAVADGLLAAGRAPETPAAVIASATTPAEKGVVGTLADIADRTASAGLTSPAVLIIGDVVSLGFAAHEKR